MKSLLRSNLAPSTRKMYRAALNEFAHLMGFNTFQIIESPFNDQDVLRYIAFLYHNGYSYASIVSGLSAITFWCKVRGWPLVVQSFIVSRALRGVKSLAVSSSRVKFPITPDVLRSLCAYIGGPDVSLLQETRLRAMFLLAFHAFLRVGEFCESQHMLRLSDVSVQASHVSITFPSYKFSLGHCPTVFIPASSTDLCPVKALFRYLSLRGTQPGVLFLDDDGQPFSSRVFRICLSRIAAKAGLASRGITPHSFRVGAATSAAAIGIPVETIQRMGRWSSRAFVRYIKFQINRL